MPLPPGFQLDTSTPNLPAGFQLENAPTFDQKVQASGPMRFVQGMRDSIDAGAQMLAHAVPDSVTNALDYIPAKLRNSDSPLISTFAEHFLADPRAGAVDSRMADTERQYQAARQANGQTGADVARFAGNLASPTNAALAAVTPAAAVTTIPRMAATGGALGLGGGLLTPVLDPAEQANFGTTKAVQGAVGLGTGAVLTPVVGKVLQAAAPYVGRVIDNLTGKTETNLARASLETDSILRQALADVGQTIDDIPKQQYDALRQQVNNALRGGKKLDAAALLRKQDFQELGLPSTLGQITRDPMQFARERNLRGVAGVGDPIMQRFDAQNQSLQQILGGYANGASERVTAGERLSQALKGVDDSMRGKVSSLYGAARESAGKDLEVPLQGLAQDASQVLEDFADKVPAAIKNKLDSYGILKGGNQTKVFTFDEANKLLQSINDHVGIDKATNTALSRLRDSVKNAMLESGSEDAFAPARAAASMRFKLQDAVPALKAAADGSVAPDAFVRKFVIGGNAAEVKGLARVLQQTSPEAYQEARAQLGAQIQRAAFGENQAGDKLLAPERLSKALRDIGTEKLSAFFSPTEITQMQRVGRVGAYINSSPGAAAVNSSNTAATALNLAANQVPGVSAKVNIVKALAMPILNARAVSRAVASEVPQETAKASPELIRRSQLAAALSGLIGSGAVAPR